LPTAAKISDPINPISTMNRRGFLTTCAAIGAAGSVTRLLGQEAAPAFDRRPFI
jgi:hypothetical protein